ncbi:hypothetical protein [Vibrio owensii]|uniref:hypothetical protein n=1 Tax=Vibrio harveyi group TaxID=717610 RepID=UPI003CC63F86
MANDILDKSISRQIDVHVEKAKEHDEYLKSYGGTFLEYRDSYRFSVRLFVMSCYLVIAAIMITFAVYLTKAPSSVYVTTYSGELHKPEICDQVKHCGLKNEKQ